MVLTQENFSTATEVRVATKTFFTVRRYTKRGICRRRVSVTLQYCIKTAKRRMTQIMPHQRLPRNSNGITPTSFSIKVE